MSIKTFSFAENRNLLLLALPLIASSMVGQSLGFFSNIFLAHLSKDSLAAGSIVTSLFVTLMIIMWGTLSVVNVMTSHAHGANDHKAAARVLQDGLKIATFASIPAMLIIWNAPPLLLLLGQKSYTVQLATAYLHGLTFAIFPDFIFSVLLHFLVGLNQTRLNLLFTFIWVSLTVACNYILMFGHLGLPKLGMAGIGWGTSIGFWIMMLLLASYIFFNKNYFPYRCFLFKNDLPSVIPELLKIGLPIGFMYCIEVGFFLSVVLLMGILRNGAQAANQIAIQYTSLVSVASFGIGQAATISIGHQLGGKNLAQAERTGYTSMQLAFIIMFIIAIVYWCFTKTLISIDFDIDNPANQQVVNLAKDFLMLAALFQIGEGIRLAAIGALRGWKDTHFSMYVSVLTYWCIALPCGYVLAKFTGLQGQGIWLAIVFSQACSALILLKRYQKITTQYQAHPQEAKALIAEVKKNCL